ncbi:MAG: hypothetical protein HC895_27470 [Leptolyngbyaceae cyanobacterium SM1_3_5]|nr:hypothetical protein [Leptolyngbyaceae cyanobacterium SM1_3_5]
MDYYSRKLYALLHESHGSHFFDRLDCFNDCLEALQQWWETQGKLASELTSTADRINLSDAPSSSQAFEIHHPISGQKLEIAANKPQPNADQAQLIDAINAVWHSIAALEPDARMQQLFTWCWRFMPESSGRSLLTPADRVLPDTALHSHNSAVSALTGALFSPDWQGGEPDRPYIVLFTFSPVQEFIKASRKFLDFWAGSYLLHYLSAVLCWEAAQLYGADAIITPSLWSQEIIDALIAQTIQTSVQILPSSIASTRIALLILMVRLSIAASAPLTLRVFQTRSRCSLPVVKLPTSSLPRSKPRFKGTGKRSPRWSKKPSNQRCETFWAASSIAPTPT